MVSMSVVKNLLTKSQRMGNYQQPLPLADDPYLKPFQIITYLQSSFLKFNGYFWIIRSYQRLFSPCGCLWSPFCAVDGDVIHKNLPTLVKSSPFSPKSSSLFPVSLYFCLGPYPSASLSLSLVLSCYFTVFLFTNCLVFPVTYDFKC